MRSGRNRAHLRLETHLQLRVPCFSPDGALLATAAAHGSHRRCLANPARPGHLLAAGAGSVCRRTPAVEKKVAARASAG